MAIYRIEQHAPVVPGSAWVAETATVIGRVELGEEASIWYGATLRGDNDRIAIGARSNVQESSVLHTDAGIQLVVGDDVTIGHQVMLHGCTIGDGSLIVGSPAKVVRSLDPAQIEGLIQSARHYVEQARRHRAQCARVDIR